MTRVTLSLCAWTVGAALLCLAGLPLAGGADQPAKDPKTAPADKASPQTKPDADGFVSIFNGKDLAGWEGLPGWWHVEDGAITSQSTAEKPCKECNYLMYRGGKPADFELRVMFKLVGGNSGIQFRSEERPKFDTFGYQADMDADNAWTGCLYEHARGKVAGRGEKVVIDEDGKRTTTKIGDAAELAKKVKRNDWNEYRVIAKGAEMTLIINGETMCQAIDSQKGRAARQGVLAFQMHPGPPMKVQFKDILLKKLD
jgi:hypothetical protein